MNIQGHTWQSDLLHHSTDLPALPPSSSSAPVLMLPLQAQVRGEVGLFAPFHDRTVGETNLSLQTLNVQH